MEMSVRAVGKNEDDGKDGSRQLPVQGAVAEAQHAIKISGEQTGGAKSITLVPGEGGVERVDLEALENARHIHVVSFSSLPDAIRVAKNNADQNQTPNAAIRRIASIPPDRVLVNGRSMETYEDDYEPGQPYKNLLIIQEGGKVVMERGTQHAEKFSMPIHRTRSNRDENNNDLSIQPGMPSKDCCAIL